MASDEMLWEEFKFRRSNLDALRIKSVSLNGITTKDIVMVYGTGGDKWISFAPHIRRADKLEFGYDIPEFSYHEWHLFLPEGFSESMECMYEFSGSLDEALHALNTVGIETKRDDEFFDY